MYSVAHQQLHSYWTVGTSCQRIVPSAIASEIDDKNFHAGEAQDVVAVVTAGRLPVMSAIQLVQIPF
jgi:hypothetical protein